MTKITFETIKKVMAEQYAGNPMEIAALNGDTPGVAKMLKESGKNPDHAGTIVELIRAGMSSDEALNSIKKD